MAQQDAIALLDADHMHVEQLFAEYQTAGEDGERKKELARAICHEITIHARIEEEIFYPAVRRATGDNQMVDDAAKEHEKARELIHRIEAGQCDDAIVGELQRAIEHHVKEEREEMFEHARRTPALDLMQLGQQLEQRKSELMASLPT